MFYFFNNMKVISCSIQNKWRSVLFYFKYANFFVSELFETFGVENNFTLENIILPVGISFYIFQSFTYVLDVYFEKIPPEKDPIKYFTFIAFFPQLVAGPIERASELLPQFNQLKKNHLRKFLCRSKNYNNRSIFKIFYSRQHRTIYWSNFYKLLEL